MPEMTLLEAAEILETKYHINGPVNVVTDELYARATACDYLRKIASREYAPVVHAHWVFGSTRGHSWMKCSKCLVSQSGQTATFTYFPSCGALMGKDDSHEAD